MAHESLIWDQVGVRCAQSLGCFTTGKEVGGLVSEPGYLGVHHRYVDVLPFVLVIFRALVNRSHHRKGGPHSGPDIGHGDANFLRVAVRLASDAHEAADSLHDLVIGGTGAVRSGLAEAGNRADDDARIDLFQGIVAQAKAIHHAWGEVLHHHVGVFDQLLEYL